MDGMSKYAASRRVVDSIKQSNNCLGIRKKIYVENFDYSHKSIAQLVPTCSD